MKKLLLMSYFVVNAAGQPVIAPTDEPVGPRRGQEIDGYNVVNSFETGYRFQSVGGNLGKYRSDVNFGNGVRLLGSSLSVQSREGHGKYFDELLLTTQGLGADPYQYSSLRIQKNRLYRYDLLWRQQDYFNPALPVASGQHFLDTTRALQDHSVVLLPQSPFRIFAGYSRVNQSGPGLSTVNLFTGVSGDVFPLFRDVRRRQNTYRLGFEFVAFGAKLSVLRGWEDFRDDTRWTSGAQPGNEATDPTSLDLLRRDMPYHGSTRNWLVNLLHDRAKFFTLNGRFTYAGTRRNFIFDEVATGISRFAGATNRQILLLGSGSRPVTTASLSISIFPSRNLTIVNHTAFHHTRMEGAGTYRELDHASLSLRSMEFGFLGIRTIANSTDVNLRVSRMFGVYGGYQYSARRIRSIEQTAFESGGDRVAAEQDNALHSARAGVRIAPVKAVSVLLDAELGRVDRPVYPISERNYHALGGRIQYKTRTLMLSVLARTNYNFNSASLLSHSAKSRTYSAEGSWSARQWFSVDASYSKLHLDTLSGIAYFYDFDLITDRSTYISNIHSGYAGVRFGIGPRADLSVGYSRVQDVGNGRRAELFTDNPSPATLGYQTYPLTFESPLARISIRLHNRLRWNAGYQHYRYGEQMLPVQNYRAHTGFSSLSWSF